MRKILNATRKTRLNVEESTRKTEIINNCRYPSFLSIKFTGKMAELATQIVGHDVRRWDGECQDVDF